MESSRFHHTAFSTASKACFCVGSLEACWHVSIAHCCRVYVLTGVGPQIALAEAVKMDTDQPESDEEGSDLEADEQEEEEESSENGDAEGGMSELSVPSRLAGGVIGLKLPASLIQHTTSKLQECTVQCFA